MTVTPPVGSCTVSALSGWVSPGPYRVQSPFCCLLKKINVLFVFERKRETEHEYGRAERESGGHRIRSRLQALSYQHRARHGS